MNKLQLREHQQKTFITLGGFWPYNKLIKVNYKMYYKSVIIHKNRIFPYFQNKVKQIK